MAESKCKGIAFAHLHEFIKTQQREGGVERVCQQLPPEVGRILRMPTAYEWYPLSFLVKADVATADTFFGGDYAKGGFAIGQFDLERSVKTVYRFFFQFLEATFVIQRSAKLWSTYNSAGKLTVETTGPKSCLVRMSDYDPQHRCLCEVFRGAFTGALTATGSKNVVMRHTDCLLEGKKESLFVGSWE